MWWHEILSEEVRRTWEPVSGEVLARQSWDAAVSFDRESTIDMLRRALVVAYTLCDTSDDVSGAMLGGLSVIRHALEESGGFQRAMGRE